MSICSQNLGVVAFGVDRDEIEAPVPPHERAPVDRRDRHRRDEVRGWPPGISAAGRLHARSVKRRDLIGKRMPVLVRVGDDVERPLTRVVSDSAARIGMTRVAPSHSFSQLRKRAGLRLQQHRAHVLVGPEQIVDGIVRHAVVRADLKDRKAPAATQSSCGEISAARQCDRAPVPADVPPPARPSWRGCTATCRACQRRSPIGCVVHVREEQRVQLLEVLVERDLHDGRPPQRPVPEFGTVCSLSSSGYGAL